MPEIKRPLLYLALSLSLCLPLAGFCADTTTAAPVKTVQMSLEQYNQLKTIIREQERTLTQLQSRLDKLDSNSTALQSQLTQAKEQLTITRQSLTTADSSLSQASETLNRQNQSLERLTEQINSMTKKEARLTRQRDTWAVAAGVLLIGCIAK